MIQSEQRSCESGVDLPELLARVEYDRELLREILGIFTEEFPSLQTQLKVALSRGDLKQVRMAAHTLKGMLASLSFSKASAAAMKIEYLAAQATSHGIAEELARMERSAACGQRSLATACDEVLR